MTQELVANMLGVRREGMTDAGGKLQKLSVIEYRRGYVTVLDRPKLEKLSCRCYAVVKKETDRLLPYLPPPRAKSIERVRENLGTTLLAAWLRVVMSRISELITSPRANLSERCADRSQSPWLRN